MSKSGKDTNGGGLGLFGAMFLVFLVLKLTGFIDWSWWLVTAPLWVPTATVLVLAAIILVGGIVGEK